MNQLGFLDFDTRLSRIDKAGDPLIKLNETVDWEIFRPTLEQARKKPKKSNAGAKGFDVILLFKILILQSLYTSVMTLWNIKFLTDTLFPGFLVSMPPARFQTQQPSGVFVKI